MPATPVDLLPVAYVTGAYGVQGWIKLHAYSNDAAALLHAKTWWLAKPLKAGGNEMDLATLHDVDRLEAKVHGDGVVARLMGVATREAAEKLKGHVVQIQRSHFPVLPDNEYYWTDLIGMAVVNLRGEHLGVVDGLIDNGAHPILQVVQQGADPQRECLIPFVEQFVPEVDQQARSIKVDWELDY